MKYLVLALSAAFIAACAINFGTYGQAKVNVDDTGQIRRSVPASAPTPEDVLIEYAKPASAAK